MNITKIKSPLLTVLFSTLYHGNVHISLNASKWIQIRQTGVLEAKKVYGKPQKKVFFRGMSTKRGPFHYEKRIFTKEFLSIKKDSLVRSI